MLTWLTKGHPDIWPNIILDISGRVLLDDMTIQISGL